jgi:hypothetical protein
MVNEAEHRGKGRSVIGFRGRQLLPDKGLKALIKMQLSSIARHEPGQRAFLATSEINKNT